MSPNLDEIINDTASIAVGAAARRAINALPKEDVTRLRLRGIREACRGFPALHPRPGVLVVGVEGRSGVVTRRPRRGQVEVAWTSGRRTEVEVASVPDLRVPASVLGVAETAREVNARLWGASWDTFAEALAKAGDVGEDVAKADVLDTLDRALHHGVMTEQNLHILRAAAWFCAGR